MKIPEKVRLSIDVIRHLRRVTDGKPRRVEDLAQILGTTKNFLHQIICHLVKSGVLTVIKGPGGGISVTLREHSLLEIYNLFGYMKEDLSDGRDSSQVEQQVRDFLAGLSI